MAYDTLIVMDRGRVRSITLNRPDVLNALNRKTLLELESAIDDVTQTPDIRAVVITGAGEKSFVAGADIREMQDFTPVEAQTFSALGHRVFDQIERLRIPVIAAVNGFALGGGLELALACDFIYASDNAQLGLVEANLGLIPGFGGTTRLARRVGIARAREMIYTGKRIKADEAAQIGLVNKVCPAADLVDVVRKTAEIIADKSPIALQLAKQALIEGLGLDSRNANFLEQQAFGLAFSTQDHSEGISAFLDKRSAVFSGR